MSKNLVFRNSIVYKALKMAHGFYWDTINLLWLLIPKRNRSVSNNKDFSIGIVTYVDRYDRFFKSLITNLIKIFPDVEFVISVNGYYDEKIQLEYLKKINAFASQFQNVKIIDFMEPQSLSKLWNLLILNASNDKIFIFNDDIKVAPWFRRKLLNSKILKEEVALINRSWSHFLISKSIIKINGYFDQRFPGVGNEDEDYECRLVYNDIFVKSYRIDGLKNIVFKTINFSYGKDTSVINTKYVKKNKIFFDSKWNTYPEKIGEAKYVEILKSYVVLKSGMETPIFYDFSLLEPNGKLVK